MWGRIPTLWAAEFGRANAHEIRRRARSEYNDVRIPFSLSLARLFGSRSDVLKTESWIRSAHHRTGDGAVSSSKVEINGRTIGSVSGGTRGAAVLDRSEVYAIRPPHLNRGKWGGRSSFRQWFRDAVTPSRHGPDYGYLW
jgi:hypothetical protein